MLLMFFLVAVAVFVTVRFGEETWSFDLIFDIGDLVEICAGPLFFLRCKSGRKDLASCFVFLFKAVRSSC